MNYLVGDIGNTLTKLSILDGKFRIKKLYTIETKKIFENSFHKLKTNGIYVIEDVSPLYLYRLSQFFRNYNLTIARLESTKASLLEDNNMIIIRK